MVRLVAISCVVICIAACGDGASSYECTPQTNCTQAGVVGNCRESTLSDSHYCAYPDGTCPSGERWGVLAGEGLAEECVAGDLLDAGPDASLIDASHIDASDIDASTLDASLVDAGPIDAALIDAMPPPPTKNVTVTLLGSGAPAGRVVSTPPGIDCPGTCTASYLQSATVTLQASGGSFLGWEGACAADLDATCVMSSSTNATVPAFFGVSGTAEWLDVLNNSWLITSTLVEKFSNGEILLVMSYSGSATFRGQALPEHPANKNAVLVTRLNPLTGKTKWLKVVESTESVIGERAQISASGDVVLYGDFTGTVDAGDAQHTAADSTDLVVIKLAGATGDTLWSKKFGSTADDAATGLGLDTAGNIVISTSCSADINFGGNALQPVGGLDMCVAKLGGASGAHLWSAASKAQGEDTASGLVVDAAGDIVLTGSYKQSTKFFAGAVQPAPAGPVGAIVVKLRSADGVFLLAKTFGGTAGAEGFAVVADGSSNIYASVYNHDATESWTLVRLSAIGSEAWRKTIPGPASSVTVSGMNLHIAGSFGGTLALDGLSVTSAGSSDGYVAVVRAADGVVTKLQRFGGGSSDRGARVAIGAKGERYVVGEFQSVAEFFGLNASAQFLSDGFLVAIAP